MQSGPRTSVPSSAELLPLLPLLSSSVRLSDDLFDLRFDFLSRLLRFLSRRLSLLFPRLYLSLLDLFLFFLLSSLEELMYEDDSESESLSDSDDSVSESERDSDSDVSYLLLFFLLSFEDLLCFSLRRTS